MIKLNFTPPALHSASASLRLRFTPPPLHSTSASLHLRFTPPPLHSASASLRLRFTPPPLKFNSTPPPLHSASASLRLRFTPPPLKFNSTPPPLPELTAVTSSIQYGYRKCRTDARVFFRTRAKENSKKVKGKSSMARSLPVENLLPQKWGQLSTTFSNH